MSRYKTLSKQGHFYIIAAPSGAGKTTLVDALVKQIDNIKISISYTTRPPRPNEVDGINYHFIDQTVFDQMVHKNKFIEHAVVFNYHYGTGKDWVLAQLNQGVDVILEIDWQGAEQVSSQFQDAISIFILPPSLEILHNRLKQRNQDNPRVIEARMAAARQEISHYHEFQYLVVNDDFQIALQELIYIIKANRLKTPIQSEAHAKLLAELLKKT